jgi:phenylpropionate dioxygenase-like ring-hydroxylating dioxygenase large terminal subunit
MKNRIWEDLTMGVLLDDAGLTQRIFDHIENKTTDLGEGIWREPVANYRSEARLKAEMEEVLRKSPVAFCPSAAIPNAGDYVAREAAGVPIVVVRERDGTVHGFRNACRHRGMQLVEGQGCAKAFTCPYHGWAYSLDGTLRHVPDEHGFPGLDKSLHGLSPVKVEEKSGLVFVTQEPSDNGLTLDEIPNLIGDDQRIFSTSETLVDANWKIFLEGFIEGYHIKAAHPETFYPYGFDNLNVVEYFGAHSRVTYPFQRIKKLEAVAPEARRVDGMVTLVYQLFPNALVTVLSSHTSLVVLEPVSLTQTRLVSYTMTNRPVGDRDAEEAAKRDAAFVNQTGAAEDRAIVCAIQKGLASGANESFTFGQFEGAIVHFHRHLTALLSQSG